MPQQELNCGECGSPMILRKANGHTYKDGITTRRFFSCSRYPLCRGTCGANPDGSPVGIPTNAETKEERRKTYFALEEFRALRLWNKKGMYSWLAKRLKMERGNCHVTNFDIETCKRVIAALDAAKERQNRAAAGK